MNFCLQGSIRRIFIPCLFSGKRHSNNTTPNQVTNLKTAEQINTKRYFLLSTCLVMMISSSSVHLNLMFLCRKHKAMGKSISKVSTDSRYAMSLWISQLLSPCSLIRYKPEQLEVLGDVCVYSAYLKPHSMLCIGAEGIHLLLPGGT